MGKYSTQYQKEQTKVKRTVHPIWRGIGFLMIILIPIIGYASAMLIMDANRQQGWFRIPEGIVGPANDPELYARLIVAGLVSVILYIFFTIISLFLLRVLAPPIHGPYDVPQPKIKVKRYKR